MKSLATAILLTLALVLAAPAAHAWTIHNHLNHELSVKRSWSFGFAKYKVRPNATLNGEPSEPLLNVTISYIAQGDYHESYSVSIPARGSASVYADHVKIHDAGNKLIKTVNMDSHAWR